jgi:hypothetical protein
MSDLVHSLGGRLEAVCLGPNISNQIVAVRLGVKLLGDESLFTKASLSPLPPRDPVSRSLETLDLSGLDD